jgi:YceI-like domain
MRSFVPCSWISRRLRAALCLFAAAGLILAAHGMSAAAEQNARAAGTKLDFVLSPASRVELRGTTNISSWRSWSGDVKGTVVLKTDPAALHALFSRLQTAAQEGPKTVQDVAMSLPVDGKPIAELTVPVMSLHGDSNGMEHDLHHALKAAQHPDIHYVFQQVQSVQAEWDSQDRQPGIRVRLTGTLSMAGVRQPITMTMLIRRNAAGHFLAHAQIALLMSDFGVTPPTAFFGLIRASNEVTAIFNLHLVEERPAASAAMLPEEAAR